MINKNSGKVILAMSLPLNLLVIVASYCGIFVEKTYSREAKYFAVQGIGQDIVNLFIVVPSLIITSFLTYQSMALESSARKENKTAMFIWSGIILYLVYSYTIYCFSMHFNFLFLVYCSIFGLSFYSFVYFVLSQVNELKINSNNSSVIKIVGIFLISVAVLFYFLWLSEIIPALMKNEVPKSIIENGIITNPVHVLDLSIFLPALIITAILLFQPNADEPNVQKKKALGFLLAASMLIFCVLMSLAIIGMIIVLHMKGMNADLSITIIFGIIASTSTILSIIFLKSITMKSN